jgi:class 3 adenylate cyclase
VSAGESVQRSASADGAAGEQLAAEGLLPGPAVAAALPGGTVTFAFTDIEDSTALLRRLGEDRYADLINQHRQIIRSAFYSADGIEIDEQGDACFFALPRAKEAVRAAVEIQRKHVDRGLPLRVEALQARASACCRAGAEQGAGKR